MNRKHHRTALFTLLFLSQFSLAGKDEPGCAGKAAVLTGEGEVKPDVVKMEIASSEVTKSEALLSSEDSVAIAAKAAVTGLFGPSAAILNPATGYVARQAQRAAVVYSVSAEQGLEIRDAYEAVNIGRAILDTKDKPAQRNEALARGKEFIRKIAEKYPEADSEAIRRAMVGKEDIGELKAETEYKVAGVPDEVVGALGKLMPVKDLPPDLVRNLYDTSRNPELKPQVDREIEKLAKTVSQISGKTVTADQIRDALKTPSATVKAEVEPAPEPKQPKQQKPIEKETIVKRTTPIPILPFAGEAGLHSFSTKSPGVANGGHSVPTIPKVQSSVQIPESNYVAAGLPKTVRIPDGKMNSNQVGRVADLLVTPKLDVPASTDRNNPYFDRADQIQRAAIKAQSAIGEEAVRQRKQVLEGIVNLAEAAGIATGKAADPFALGAAVLTTAPNVAAGLRGMTVNMPPRMPSGSPFSQDFFAGIRNGGNAAAAREAGDARPRDGIRALPDDAKEKLFASLVPGLAIPDFKASSAADPKTGIRILNSDTEKQLLEAIRKTAKPVPKPLELVGSVEPYSTKSFAFHRSTLSNGKILEMRPMAIELRDMNTGESKQISLGEHGVGIQEKSLADGRVAIVTDKGGKSQELLILDPTAGVITGSVPLRGAGSYEQSKITQKPDGTLVTLATDAINFIDPNKMTVMNVPNTKGIFNQPVALATGELIGMNMRGEIVRVSPEGTSTIVPMQERVKSPHLIAGNDFTFWSHDRKGGNAVLWNKNGTKMTDIKDANKLQPLSEPGAFLAISKEGQARIVRVSDQGTVSEGTSLNLAARSAHQLSDGTLLVDTMHGITQVQIRDGRLVILSNPDSSQTVGFPTIVQSVTEQKNGDVYVQYPGGNFDRFARR